MNSNFRRLGTSELLPRYSFSEALIANRAVLELGAVASTGGRSAESLLHRGARTVVACDADLSAVEAAQKQRGTPSLRFRPHVFDDLMDGEFDLLFIADLAPYIRSPEMLVPLIRLLSMDGHLIGGLRNPSGFALAQMMDPEGPEAPPTYGQLLDALSPHFPSVQLATQTPLVGYQLALADAQGFAVDGSLVEESEAAYFLAVAGRQPLASPEALWTQLPVEPLAYTRDRLEDTSRQSRAWEEKASQLKELLARTQQELAQREERLSTAERSRATLQARAEELSQKLEVARQQLESQAGEVRFINEERKRLSHLIEELEAERSRLRERLEQAAQSDVDEEWARIVLEREARLEALQRRIAERESEITALRKALGKVAPHQVQQIYQRAAAEISAVKAELFGRQGESAAAPKPTPPLSGLSGREEKEGKS